MRDWSGIGNSVVVEMTLAAIAICLVAGILVGCGSDEPSGNDSAAIDPSPQSAKVNQGNNAQAQGPDQTQADGPDKAPANQDQSGAAAKPPPGTGSGNTPPPPVLDESRLSGIGAGLPGEIGMMVSATGGPGPQLLLGRLTLGPAGSTINLPVAERVLKNGKGPSGVSEQTRGQINAAISRSDNAAATALFSGLVSENDGPTGASKAVVQTLQVDGGSPGVAPTQGGDGSSPGQILWPLGAQNRYMAALAGGCRVDVATQKFLLAQMAPADGRESFGLGARGPSARWISSSGAGPNGKVLVRQMGMFNPGGGQVVVAMMALPGDGSPKTGKKMLTGLTDRLASRLADQAPPKRPCTTQE